MGRTAYRAGQQTGDRSCKDRTGRHTPTHRRENNGKAGKRKPNDRGHAEAFQSRRVIQLVKQMNPEICIVARAHSEGEYRYLSQLGCALVITGEREIALGMTDYTLQRMGVNATVAQALVDELRSGAEQQAAGCDEA
jgi:hypothetical protein